MVIFHLPQFEHEPFLQYLSRLNDYCAQYTHFMYEKWEIYDFVLKDITHKPYSILGFMCYGGLCPLDVDDICDLFKSKLHTNDNMSVLAILLCVVSHLSMVCTLNLHV